jgi:serine/threonine protein kinase
MPMFMRLFCLAAGMSLDSSAQAHRTMCKGNEANGPANAEARRQLVEKVQREETQVGPYELKTRLVRLINGGSFGQIFLGETVTDSAQVAVKIEHPGQAEQLLYEGQVYRKLEGGPGIPKVWWYGMHGSMFNVLVMDLLGPSLHDLFMESGHKFSLKTVLMLVDQMLDCIQHVHARDFVHRDISANNFMMGLGEQSSKLFLVDYGLAKRVNSSPGWNTMKSRMMFKYVRPMVGTARFCSIFCHQGQEEARRDDMESLGYLWLYLLRGKLPWQGIAAATSMEKLEAILSVKLATSLQDLCAGLPEEFLTYMTFVRAMGQYDVPNYDAIKALFRALAAKEGIEYDYQYDWSPGRGKKMEGGAGDGGGDYLESGESGDDYMGAGERGDYLRAPRTISTCSSDPSEGIVSH